MQDNGSTYEGEGSDRQAGAHRRGGTAVRPRPRSDTTVIDLRDGTKPKPASGRRFAPYPGESQRDAIVATALAFHQSVPQAPSVLDIDAAALRMPASGPVCKPGPEPCWTPPALPALPVETATAALSAGPADDIDLEDLHRPATLGLRRSWLIGAAAAGLVALLGGGLTTLLFERDEMAVGAAASMALTDDVADPALAPEDGIETNDQADSGAPLASVEGRLTLDDAAVFTWPAAVEATPGTSFAVDTQVVLRLNAAYSAEAGDDTFWVVWFRGDQELRRDELLLADVMQRVSYAPALDQPGQYRADVVLNDQIVWSVPFEATVP
jgi:hypothetical protein